MDRGIGVGRYVDVVLSSLFVERDLKIMDWSEDTVIALCASLGWKGPPIPTRHFRSSGSLCVWLFGASPGIKNSLPCEHSTLSRRAWTDGFSVDGE